MEGFDGTPATLSGTDYGTSSSVRIDAGNTDARWWAMTQLSISGTLRHPSLVPGAHLVFNRSDRTTRTGAGAAPLAALLQERGRMAGRRAGVVLCGGNIDLALFRDWVLGEARGEV